MHLNDETREDRVRAAIEAQRALKQALHQAYSPDWIHMDLSMGQLKALMGLATLGAMSVGELADWLKTSKPSASVLVDRLVHEGYVERREDQDDRRRTLVMLTSRGSELVAGLERSGGERMELWLDRMLPDDLAALTRGIRALADVVSGEVASGGGNAGASPGAGAATATGNAD